MKRDGNRVTKLKNEYLSHVRPYNTKAFPDQYCIIYTMGMDIFREIN